MKIDKQNVFSFPNPESWSCIVWMYNEPHLATLLIKVSHPEAEKNVWLFFDGVIYFQGPFSWQGAKFDIATLEEQHKLRIELGQGEKGQYLLNGLIKMHNLYIVEGKHQNHPLSIKLLARDCTISYKQYNGREFFTPIK